MLATNTFKQITNKMFMTVKQRIRLVRHLQFLRSLIVFTTVRPACTLSVTPAAVPFLHVNSYITSC